MQGDDFIKPLASEPFNKYNDVKCPDCQSKGWYRRLDGVFVCRKCSRQFTIEPEEKKHKPSNKPFNPYDKSKPSPR